MGIMNNLNLNHVLCVTNHASNVMNRPQIVIIANRIFTTITISAYLAAQRTQEQSCIRMTSIGIVW